MAYAQSTPLPLPTISFLGEGPGTYTLPAGYSQLIVKKHTPFRFEVLQQGSYTSTKKSAPPERVWACEGNCVLPAVYHDVIDFGYLAAGTVIELVIIDDDNDARLNFWALDDPAVPYQTINMQGMVQTASLTVPYDAHVYLYAADSIGVVQPTINQPIPTPTATQTSTPTPTATQTPIAIDTPTSTPTLTSSPTVEPSEMPTVTATPSPTMTFQIGQPVTPTPTSTPTATPTSTRIVITLEPTNLDPDAEPGRTVFLPVVNK